MSLCLYWKSFVERFPSFFFFVNVCSGHHQITRCEEKETRDVHSLIAKDKQQEGGLSVEE